jgi:hypothetical protein
MTEKITLQKIFDLAWQAFIVEGKSPGNEKGCLCEYLTASGRKCAIGLALPDGHPAQKSDLTFPVLVNEFPELFDDEIHEIQKDAHKSNLDDDDVDDHPLAKFQFILHDAYADYGIWKISANGLKEIYIKIAEQYDLSVPNEQ